MPPVREAAPLESLFLFLSLLLAFVCWAITSREIAVVGFYSDISNYDEAKAFFSGDLEGKERFVFKTRPPGVPAGDEISFDRFRASFSAKQYAAVPCRDS
jgi:hypothetical protein